MLPIDVVKKAMDSIETGDVETTGIYIAESLAVSGILAGETLGKREFMELLSGIIDAIPNWTFHTVNIEEKGSLVQAAVQITGMHTGALRIPFLGIQSDASWERFALPEETFECCVRTNKIYTIKSNPVPGGGLQGLLKKLGVSLQQKVAV